MQSSGSAAWQGDLVAGSGTVSLGSGLAGPLDVSWRARTESQNGSTNPEELIAAAHAACYAMALSHGLAGAGHPPSRLETGAVVEFGPKEGGGFEIKSSALTVRADVPGLSPEAFQEAAQAAKDGCPVSQALAGNVELSVDAALM